MKKFTIILIVFVGLLFNYTANAQCTPDPNCSDPEGDGEYCPSQFPNAVEDEYYEETLTIIAPISQQGIVIHHIDLLSITNIPPGMNYQCQDDDCSFWPGIAKCVNVSGTPDIGSWGTYKLYLSIEIFMDVNGFPVSLGVVQDSSSTVTIDSQLHADFDIDYGPDNVVCNNFSTSIYYTGDATESATYNWNFGENAIIISGEGQGPYEIEYPSTYSGMDSISLEVQESPYTSPVFTQAYYVDVCIALDEKEIINIEVRPNPVVNYLFINTGNSMITKAVIYDLTGKEVYEALLQKNSNSLDLSQLQKGIYFLSLINDKTSITQKIIKK